MNSVLFAADADWVSEEVFSALVDAETYVSRVASGREIAAAFSEVQPDLILLDMQIGSMGGAATCLDLKHEMEAGRMPPVPILLLLDREADSFLAKEAGADAWLVKPLNPLRLRRTAEELLALKTAAAS